MTDPAEKALETVALRIYSDDHEGLAALRSLRTQHAEMQKLIDALTHDDLWGQKYAALQLQQTKDQERIAELNSTISYLQGFWVPERVQELLDQAAKDQQRIEELEREAAPVLLQQMKDQERIEELEREKEQWAEAANDERLRVIDLEDQHTKDQERIEELRKQFEEDGRDLKQRTEWINDYEVQHTKDQERIAQLEVVEIGRLKAALTRMDQQRDANSRAAYALREETERLKAALTQIRDWDENGKVFTGMHASAAVKIAAQALEDE
jgi:uncharacterized small protein (DUF1192 family)